MSYRLYLCDLPPDCIDEQIAALLQPYGQVLAVEWESASDTVELRRAIVELDAPFPLLEIVGQMNQQSIGDQAVIASPALPPDGPLELTKRSRKFSLKISVQLGEQKWWPCMKIRVIISACGPRFALNMMERAKAIQESGGMLIPDGSRQRTLGGIFFVLAREYVTPDVGRYIFHQTKRIARERKAAAKRGDSLPVDEAALATVAAQPVEEATAEDLTAQPAEPLAPAPEPDLTPEPEADLSPEPPVAEVAPEPDPVDLARQRLDALREEMYAAQSELEAVKAGQVSKATGVFSLMKQILDAQKAIDALLAEHPALKQ